MGAEAGVTVVLATQLPGASGGLAVAASVAVAAAVRDGSPVLLLEAEGPGRRGPTMLASAAARELEERLRGEGADAAARGRLCWMRLDAGAGIGSRLSAALEVARPFGLAVAWLPPGDWREAVADAPAGGAALVHADLPAQRSLAALVVDDLLRAGFRVRVSSVAPGLVGARRALAGLEAGGEAGRRAARLAAGLCPAVPERQSNRGGRQPAVGPA